MLMPSKVKFRKQQRGRRRGLAQRGAEVSFGDYGLKVLRAGGSPRADRGLARRDDPLHQARREDLGARLPRQADHEEAGRNAHGQGQGGPEAWVAVVKPGKIIFEMEGLDEKTARAAMLLASSKLRCRRAS
jgi:large subunit ribosomal protein L16